MFAAMVALLLDVLSSVSHDLLLEISMLSDLFMMSTSIVGLAFVVYARRKLSPARVDRPPDPPSDAGHRSPDHDHRPLPGAGVVTNGFEV